MHKLSDKNKRSTSEGLPTAITGLLEAQSRFDSAGFSSYFSDNAVVYDEGKTFTGREEIRKWNLSTNDKYKTLLEPSGYNIVDDKIDLSVKVSGSFPGSPINVKYHFQLINNQITSLRIT